MNFYQRENAQNNVTWSITLKPLNNYGSKNKSALCKMNMLDPPKNFIALVIENYT